MLAHSFSVSKPPRPEPKPSVGKKQLMRQTREAALQFVLSHDNEWCLVGTYPVSRTKTRRQAQSQAKYYQQRLEEYFATALAYYGDQYPTLWDFYWNKSKRQYEVRVLCAYRPTWGYGYDDIAESNAAAHYEMTGEKRQVNAVKKAMDSLFFNEVPYPS